MTTPTPFDVAGPLPQGTVLLEASAGTGKTWTIGALVARYVADGVPLEDLLVITFGRAASRELRERVRGHLSHVHRQVAEPALPSADPVVVALRAGEPAEVAERTRRLRDALTHFDAATIATTHQFCQLVLRGLGVAGDTDPHARLVDDLSDLRDEVVDDLYVRGFAGSSGPPAFTRARADQIARAVTENAHAVLDPDSLGDGSADARMLRFAHLVRQEMDRRKRRLGVLGYDDLLSHLAAALRDEASPARARMRQRWRVVLVDEFQDTDPVQWHVLDRAFTGHSTLVLIGDPKQAIYGFRGGDVDTYLTASATAASRHTLDTNHRSDAPLVRSLSVLLGGAELGDGQIVVHPVRAARESSRLGVAPGVTPRDGLLAPVRLRVIPSEQLLAPGETQVPIGKVRPLVAADCAAEITRLLSGGVTFAEGIPEQARALRPSDIAVLAHTRAQLDIVRAALEQVGVRSVIVSSDSIYDSDAARDWLTLLEAMELSHRPERVRAAALTPFVGSGARALDQRGDDLTDDVSHRLRTWAGLFGRRGVAAVLAAASADGLDARVLTRTDGERRLTDLRHVGEILHQRVVAEGDGLASLTAWLRERMSAVRKEERARRLDSDADAVHLATIHASKGLQYPIVLLPFVADRWVADQSEVLHFHRPDRTRCLDIGIRSDPGRRARADQHALEESGESLRLLYVALTRAQSQVITWWFPSARNTAASPLHRVLFGRAPGAGPVPHRHPVPGDESMRERVADWERRGALRVEEIEPTRAEPVHARRAVPEVSVRAFTRRIDDAWRRTSYTALTRPLDEARSASGPHAEDLLASEPEETARQDDEDGIAAPATRDGATDDLIDGGHRPSPMADLPVGAGFGSLVHAVLEEADPDAPDLRAELRGHLDEQLVHWPVPDLDRATLVDALVEVIDTPLGPLAPGTTLRDIAARDRMCEMDFELPLSGGDAGHASPREAVLGDLAQLMRTHLPPQDPVLPFADVLTDPALGGQALRGYLTGSLDIVLRVDQRYLVVDYKTNWLGPPDTPLSTKHYGPAALAEAMNHSSYPLQAILYGVVLHRFLRWRQPGYDPAIHFGGVLYLYLRGMVGPDTPIIDGQPSGVFSWAPPIALIQAVSDLLDGRGPSTNGTP